MKIILELDTADLGRIRDNAHALGPTASKLLDAELAFRPTRDRSTAVRERVLLGWTDAEIAADLGDTNAAVARARRGWNLPANRAAA